MSIIEHVVLIKIKEGKEQSKVNAMVDEINGLVSLDSVLHLSNGPILPAKSSSVSNFTHFIHGRFKSKEDLGAYLTHPAHLRVAGEIVIPLAEDFVMVDWVADRDPHPLIPSPGSAIKITLLKLKPNVAADEEILGAIGEGGSVNCGENFSESGKGFSICSIAVFPGVSEMEAAAAAAEEKVGNHVDDVIVVDFVVPPLSSFGL